MKRNEKEIMSDIFNCYLGLSPENLWMDGEATREQAAATEKKIVFNLKTLFRELGREVTEQEAYNFYRNF